MLQNVRCSFWLVAGLAACSTATAHAAPTAPATSATRTVYHDVNHVGHVVLERDDTGAVLGTPHRYSPYGVVLGDDVVPGEAPRFGGKLRDATSGLDDVHARHYTSDYARFLSVDAAQDGSHYYVFGNNNPLKYTDPTGQMVQGLVHDYFLGGLDDARSGLGDVGLALGYGAWSWAAAGSVGWGLLQAGWGVVDAVSTFTGLGGFVKGVALGAATYAGYRLRHAARRIIARRTLAQQGADAVSKVVDDGVIYGAQGHRYYRLMSRQEYETIRASGFAGADAVSRGSLRLAVQKIRDENLDTLMKHHADIWVAGYGSPFKGVSDNLDILRLRQVWYPDEIIVAVIDHRGRALKNIMTDVEGEWLFPYGLRRDELGGEIVAESLR